MDQLKSSRLFLTYCLWAASRAQRRMGWSEECASFSPHLYKAPQAERTDWRHYFLLYFHIQIRTECKSSKIPYSFSEPFFIHLLHFGFPTPGTVALAPGRETASIHHQQKHSPAKRSRNWIIYSISLQTQSKFPQHLSMAARRRKPLKARNFLSCHQTSYCFQGLNIQKNTSSSAHPSKEIPWCVCVLFYCQEAGGKFNKLWWRLV